MGTPAKLVMPARPLKASHLRMLQQAQFGSLLKPDPFDPTGYLPDKQLPLKGAVAYTIIRGLQSRGLLDATGGLTQAGHERLAEMVTSQDGR